MTKRTVSEDELNDALEMAGLPRTESTTGFDSPNYTNTPNDLFDKLLPLMGETELKVTLAVIRGVLGWHQDSFKCSLVALSKLTGLSPNGVIAGALAAEERGTIEKVTNGRKTTEWRVRFTTSASEVRKKRATSASEVRLPQPVRDSRRLKKEKEKDIPRKERAVQTPRPHDLLFDTIGEVCQVDPATAGASIGKVKATLGKASPPYTPEEVAAFARLWWTDFGRTKPPTLWNLQEQIGRVRLNGKRPAPVEEYFAEVHS